MQKGENEQVQLLFSESLSENVNIFSLLSLQIGIRMHFNKENFF